MTDVLIGLGKAINRLHHLFAQCLLSVCLCNLFPLSHLFILPPDTAGEHAALHRQRSLPHRPPVIPLVARIADQNTSGTPAMTEREASRLDKFKQLLAGPNTDLGKRSSSSRVHITDSMCCSMYSSTVHLSHCRCVTLRLSAFVHVCHFLCFFPPSKLLHFFIFLALFLFLTLSLLALSLPAVLRF